MQDTAWLNEACQRVARVSNLFLDRACVLWYCSMYRSK